MKQFITILLTFSLCASLLTAEGQVKSTSGDKSSKETKQLLTITGKIVDGNNNKPLVFASVSLVNNRISNVSNGEGFFSVKLPISSIKDTVKFSFIGYETKMFLVKDLKNTENNIIIRLHPIVFTIPEAIVTPNDAESIVLKSISRIEENYPLTNMQMTAFYREMIKKGGNYVTLTEAALDINKSSYGNHLADQASIYKGRGSVDWQRIDTIFVKFRGGINASFDLDIAKYPFMGVLAEDIHKSYNFSLDRPTFIDGKEHYVIDFSQKEGLSEFLYNGKLYIEKESFAITRAEYSLNIGKREKEAATLFIKKKPRELRAEMKYASYLIQYKEYQGKYVFDYTRTELKFDAKWSGKLFKNSYTILSEMAITEKNDIITKIPYDQRVKNKDIALDRVSDFKDDEFWSDYNVIEPETGIENVISRIIKQLNKKDRKR